MGAILLLVNQKHEWLKEKKTLKMSTSVIYTGLSSLELSLSTEQSLPPEATTLVSCYDYYNNFLIILARI